MRPSYDRLSCKFWFKNTVMPLNDVVSVLMLLRSCCCWHLFWSCCFYVGGVSSAAIGFSAVARVLLLLTSLLLLVLPTMLVSLLILVSLLMLASMQWPMFFFFSIYDVEWHSTVDTNGKLAAAAVVVGKFATGINDTSGQWKPPRRCDHRCRWYRLCTLTCENLREFSEKFEMTLIL